MATRRNADGPTMTIDRTVPGLAARQVAHGAVSDLLVQGRAFALEDALSQSARDAGLDAADASLARAIATATFRRLGFLRRMLAARMTQGLPPDQPRLVALLVTGAAQILDLNVPDHAAVDLSVRLAKGDPYLQHTPGLVNAILRRVIRERDAIAAEASDPLGQNTPDWLAARWTAAYGRETAQAIATAHLTGAALDITPRGSPEEWAERLGGVALPTGSIRLHEVRSAVSELPGYEEGAWWVQDAAAAIPARLLDVKPGERVADLCAAPGGKTAQLAAAGAAVVAVDRSAPRLERLSLNLARLGLNAEIRVGDATQLPEADAFDAVLLDAPCSATGTIRRHPDVAWTKAGADVGRLAGLQRRLLDRAASVVKPGGRLVYCTCSLEPEEGERQVEAFLARNAEFERLAIRPDEVGGLTEIVTSEGDLRTLPFHLAGPPPAPHGGLDGFFASRLIRKG